MALINGLNGLNETVNLRARMLERLSKKTANFEDALGTCLEQQSSSSAVNLNKKKEELNESTSARYNSTTDLYQLPAYVVNAKRGTTIIEQTM